MSRTQRKASLGRGTVATSGSTCKSPGRRPAPSEAAAKNVRQAPLPNAETHSGCKRTHLAAQSRGASHRNSASSSDDQLAWSGNLDLCAAVTVLQERHLMRRHTPCVFSLLIFTLEASRTCNNKAGSANTHLGRSQTGPSTTAYT